MKICSKCKHDKDDSAFSPSKRLKSGLHSWCKECVNNQKKNAYATNPDKFKAQKAKFYKENRDRVLARAKERQPIAAVRRKVRYHTDPDYFQKVTERNRSESHKALRRAWGKANLSVMSKHVSMRRANKNSATPPWLNFVQLAQIQEMYDVALARSVQTGVPHHVDHVHPLKGKGFRGLHVPWNLQIILASDNLSKSNKLPINDLHMSWETAAE